MHGLRWGGTVHGRYALISIAVCLACTPFAAGHAVYMTFARHDTSISVDPTNIDVTIELTFHEMPSLAERRRMDRDHDRTITAAEMKVYLTERSSLLQDGVTMTVDGRPVDVVELYEPEIDLLDVNGIAPSHHIL